MAEDLEILVHNITKEFPKDEKFRSVDQLKRSSSLTTNNIAEGYNRYSFKEKIRTLVIAKGEAEETKRNILKSAKKGFLDTKQAEGISNQYTELLKGISGYIRFLKDQSKEKIKTQQLSNY